MTDVLMYDGLNSDAPAIARAFPGARKVAGYLNGRYAWSQADWDLFPGADHVTITVTASAGEGDVLDVETGDATPAQAAAWIEMRHAAGLYRPTIYCSLSVVPAIRAATGPLILGRDYDIWVAKFDGSGAEPAVPGLPAARFAAKQYETNPSWDESVLYDPEWPHRVAAHPAPAPAPAGPSGTATGANVAWHPVDGVSVYRIQKRDGRGAITELTSSLPRAALQLAGPGPHSWRVQAVNGAWTDWQRIG